VHRVLVTGVGGFIGSNVAAAMAQNRHLDVVGIVRETSDKTVLNLTAPNLNLVSYSSDTDLEKLLTLLAPQYIVHIAAGFASDDDNCDISQLVNDNIKFGALLLKFVPKQSFKGFINTCSYWQFSDDMNLRPVNYYAAAKNAFLDFLHYSSETYDFKCLNLILFDVFGKNDPRTKLIASLPKLLSSGKTIELSPAYQKLDLVYITDVNAAYCNALDYLRSEHNLESPQDTFFTVRSGKLRTLRYIVNQFVGVSESKVHVAFGAKPYRSNEVMVPMKFIRCLPQWKPEITLEKGIKLIFGVESG